MVHYLRNAQMRKQGGMIMKKLFVRALYGAIAAFLLAAGIRAALSQAAYARAASEGVLLVNAWNPLPDDFRAGDLVELYAQKRYFKLAASDIYLVREAFEAANEMFRQANRDGIEGFTITSGYRSEVKQRTLYENDEKGTAAKPGTSEHQSGLAFDVTTRYDSGDFEGTKQFLWLYEHCWEYGFILRYPKGREDITGIPYEPWHYRYVGADIARKIRDNGWTLEEYCEQGGI